MGVIEMEYKHFEIKSFDEEKGIFEGYCAVKHNVDSYGDIILDGAFLKTIDGSKQFPILFMHDPSKPVGLSTFMKEDPHGLYTRGQLDLDTELGRMVYSGLKKKYITMMSIGYTVKEDSMNKKGNRLLKEINLLEYSLITKNFAANSEALVSGFKYNAESDGENMERDMRGLQEDMKDMREDHEELRRKHDEMKRRHRDLREDHEDLKRKYEDIEEDMKDMRRCMGIDMGMQPGHELRSHDNDYMESKDRRKSSDLFFLDEEDLDITAFQNKAVGGSSDLPLAPSDHAWSGPEAKKRIFAWAGGDKFNPKKAKKAFFYYDESKANEKTAYKLPFADVIDGRLMCVPRAIKAVEGALNGVSGHWCGHPRGRQKTHYL